MCAMPRRTRVEISAVISFTWSQSNVIRITLVVLNAELQGVIDVRTINARIFAVMASLFRRSSAILGTKLTPIQLPVVSNAASILVCNDLIDCFPFSFCRILLCW
jgi:hypothetical protein